MENQKLDLANLHNNPLEFWKLMTVSHPNKGKIPVHTHPWNIEMMNNVFSHKKNILVHARQLGVSTFEIFYALWSAMFTSYNTVQIVVVNRSNQAVVLNKLLTAYYALPKSITDIIQIKTSHETFTFSNGSTIHVKAASSENVIGNYQIIPQVVIMDQFAFYENAEKIYNEINYLQPKSLLISSTPSTKPNSFFELLTQSESGFHVSKYDWRANIDHDDKWAANQMTYMTLPDINAELYANFPGQNCDLEVLRNILIAHSSSA
jgi:hypothetical protein